MNHKQSQKTHHVQKNLKKKFWVILFFYMLAFLVPALTLKNLEFDNSIDAYVPQESDYNIDYLHMLNIFGNDEAYVLYFKGDDLLTQKVLSSLKEFDLWARDQEIMHRTLSPFNLEVIENDENGDLVIAPLIGNDLLENFSIERFHDRLKLSDQADKSIISKDQKSIALILVGEKGFSTVDHYFFKEKFMDKLKELGLDPYLKHITGNLAVDVFSMEISFHDLSLFIPLTSMIGFGLIYYFFGGFFPVMISMIAIDSVIGLVMSFFPIFGIRFNIISSMVPTLMTALGVAFIIHLYSSIARLQDKGESLEDAVNHSLDHIFWPSFFTMLTTCFGFLSLGLSEIPPIRHFAFISSAGILALFFSVIYSLPVFILIYKKFSFQSKSSSQERNFIDHIVLMLYRFSIRYSKQVIIVFILFFVLAIPIIMQVEVETSLIKFFRDDHQITKDTSVIQEEIGGTNFLQIYLKDKSGLLKDVDFLHQLEKVTDQIAEIDGVDNILSYVDIIKDIHRGFSNRSVELPLVLPQDSNLIEQYLFVYDGKDLFELVNRDFTEARIQVNIHHNEAGRIEKITQRIGQIFKEANLPVTFHFTGHPYMFVRQNHLIVDGQISSLWVSILVIFILMAIQWKSLFHAALSMIPNISPLFFIFFIMGIAGIWLDIGTALIASVTIGIAVDDTIHLYTSFKNNYRGNVMYTLYHVYHDSGKAIVLTTFILCSQYIVLYFSQYVPTGRFGLLTSFGLVMALVSDLILLPAILFVYYRHKEKK